jgi:DNA-binding response OmpR family regulator
MAHNAAIGFEAMSYRFDGYELDTETMELRHSDGLVPMEPQVYDVLAYLVRNHARVVIRDERRTTTCCSSTNPPGNA